MAADVSDCIHQPGDVKATELEGSAAEEVRSAIDTAPEPVPEPVPEPAPEPAPEPEPSKTITERTASALQQLAHAAACTAHADAPSTHAAAPAPSPTPATADAAAADRQRERDAATAVAFRKEAQQARPSHPWMCCKLDEGHMYTTKRERVLQPEKTIEQLLRLFLASHTKHVAYFSHVYPNVGQLVAECMRTTVSACNQHAAHRRGSDAAGAAGEISPEAHALRCDFAIVHEFNRSGRTCIPLMYALRHTDVDVDRSRVYLFAHVYRMVSAIARNYSAQKQLHRSEDDIAVHRGRLLCCLTAGGYWLSSDGSYTAPDPATFCFSALKSREVSAEAAPASLAQTAVLVD